MSDKLLKMVIAEHEVKLIAQTPTLQSRPEKDWEHLTYLTQNYQFNSFHQNLFGSFYVS